MVRKNQILSALPAIELERFLQKAELVNLNLNDVLAEGGTLITHCYYPLDAVVTLVSNLEDGRSVEVGLIGNEGMVGYRVILGCTTGAYLAVVQIPGACIRIKSSAVREEFKRAGVFQDSTLCYIRTIMAQVSQTAACNRAHLLGKRLCRWLLSFHDRVGSNELDITHELLSQMLGANRSDVSRAIGGLREQAVLDVYRGKIIITNRRHLEELSCECYSLVKNDYMDSTVQPNGHARNGKSSWTPQRPSLTARLSRTQREREDTPAETLT